VVVARACLILAGFAACDARLGAARLAPDSSGGSGGGSSDAASGAIDAAPDAPACFNGRVVFLDFEGVTLAQAMTDDATQNQARWIGLTTANVPPYHAGDANRAADISNITDAIRSILGGYPIIVVTTRPATGPYVMVAFGGTKAAVGTGYSYATAFHDCGDTVKSDVAWLSDVVPTSKAADYAVGAIGWALGLQGTSDVDDCMCGWANGCQQSSAHCALHGPISTTNSSSPATTCPGLSTEDEVATFSAAFCQ
jgi:hypothetical protein